MYRILFLLFFLTVSAGTLLGQSRQDVVYTKSGSVLKGIIKERNDSTLRIEIYGGSILAVYIQDVDSIGEEEWQKPNLNRPISFQKNGFFQEFSFGLPWGVEQYGVESGIILNYAINYQLKDILKLGVGSGLDFYGYRTFTPYFVRISGDFAQKKNNYFYQTDLGYSSSVSWENEFVDHKGGFMAFIGGGIKFNSWRKSYWKLAAGYRIQFAQSDFNYTWEAPFTEYRQFYRLETKVIFGI